jgi:hypothetical protein
MAHPEQLIELFKPFSFSNIDADDDMAPKDHLLEGGREEHTLHK